LSPSEIFHHPNVTIPAVFSQSQVATVWRKLPDEVRKDYAWLLQQDARVALHIHMQDNVSSLHPARNK
jgi:hypothetical protein